MKPIDLRSDTVTKPTKEMYEAMAAAPLGDDVYEDDPTVNLLEAKAAERLGKEAALLVPTGTMGNLIAVLSHTRPGQEMILEEKSHMFLYEVAGVSRIAGVQTRPLNSSLGQMVPERIEEAIRPANIHFPETGLIALENTHNMHGGALLPLDYMKKISSLAKHHHLPVHLDGARIFNAAVALETDVRAIAQHADSVMFCLSKGLCAPVGSMLVGGRAFIDKARKHRKMLGGGMRQAGILAACGIVALETMVDRLQEDHDNARFLAEELLKTSHFITQPGSVKTNIVNAALNSETHDAFDLLKVMVRNGVLANARSKRDFRFVTHRDVSREQILEAVFILNNLLN